MFRLYVLKCETIPVEAEDIMEWRDFFDSDTDRIVKREYVGDVFISTVFLGVDHSGTLDGPPILFETKIFGGDYDGLIERYSTFEEAKAGHKRIKKSLKVKK